MEGGVTQRQIRDDRGDGPRPPARSGGRVGAAALAQLVGPTVATATGPFYRRLAAAVTAAVHARDLPGGSWLPSERQLAERLGVARGTVVAAYELLAAEGVVERRQGSGTWVVEPEPVDDGVGERDAALRARRLMDGFFRGDDGIIDLAPAVIPSLEGLPLDAFHPDLAAMEAMAAGHGYLPLGLPDLRTRLAALHAEAGLPTTANQVGITVGALQAIALVVRLLVRPGDRVVVESATFPGAIDILARAGARLETVRSDGAGALPDDLARVVERCAPRLVYLVPTSHNPTGTVMPDHRRREVAALADATGTWVLEDECLAWSTTDGRRPPAIAALSTSDRVVTIGSLSKLYWGGLRVGWVRADEALIARLGRLKAAEDLGNCSISQAVALGLLDQYEDVVAHRRAELRHKLALLAGLLQEQLPDWTVAVPDGGVCLWPRLPAGAADDLLPTALAHGVAFLPGSSASPREEHLDHLRLAATLPPALLEEAVRRLASAWADFRPGSSAGRSGPVPALG